MFLAHTQSGEGRTLEGDEFITLIVVIFSLVYAYQIMYIKYTQFYCASMILQQNYFKIHLQHEGKLIILII